MGDMQGKQHRTKRAFPLHIVVFAISIVLVVLLVGWFAYNDAQTSKDKALRTSETYGTRVESVLEDLFHKTDILKAIVITQDGELSNQTFTDLAKTLDDGAGIRSIQCLPDGIVTYLYPLEGNEAALNGSVFNNPLRRDDAQLAVDTKEITLSGPYELTQGGLGLVARNPIFLPSESGDDAFWGFSVIVLDLPDALESVALAELETEGYRYELLASSEEGDRLVVNASDEPPAADAVECDVAVPNHTWKLRLSPANGWVNVGLFACIGLLGLVVSLLLAMMVRQARKSRRLLSNQAMTDELTGMYNRRWFADMVESKCTQPHPQPFWLFYLDLNGFKAVNDTHGHQRGDLLLMQVAHRFEDICSDECKFARLGGDEFVVTLPGSDRASAQRLKEQLQRTLDDPFCLEGCRLGISVSIGVAAFPEDGTTYDELLYVADARMYQEKHDDPLDA